MYNPENLEMELFVVLLVTEYIVFFMGKGEHINIQKASKTKCNRNNELLSTFHSPPTIFRRQILCAHTNMLLKIITVLFSEAK